MRAVLRLLHWLVVADARHRESAAFSRLDARLLRDIGADRAAGPNWDAPPHWRLPAPSAPQTRCAAAQRPGGPA